MNILVGVGIFLAVVALLAGLCLCVIARGGGLARMPLGGDHPE